MDLLGTNVSSLEVAVGYTLVVSFERGDLHLLGEFFPGFM